MSLTHLEQIRVDVNPDDRVYWASFLQNDEVESPFAIIKHDGEIEVHGDVASLKNQKTIDLPVQKRDPQWLNFKGLVFSEYQKKKLYQPICHPDFADWKTSRPASKTLDLILKVYGDVKDKIVLDIGCCVGYYSHMLALKGAIVVGIDRNLRRLKIASELSKVYGLPEDNPRFIYIDFGRFMLYNQDHFDFVIFLNTIQHIMAQNPNLGWRGLSLLSENADAMCLNYGTKRPHDFTPKRCLKRTSFTHVRQLGLPEENPRGYEVRPLFYFWKEPGAGIIEVDVEDLWESTYSQSKKGFRLGNLHLATSRAFKENPQIPVEELGLWKYLLSEEFQQISGKKKNPVDLRRYLERYREDFRSLKQKGYRPDIDVIKVWVDEKGKYHIRDGNRRLSAIIVLGLAEKIQVQIVDKMWKRA